MHADTLTSTFQALADPTRRAILARLARGDASVGELAAPFTISLPAISRHLKVLEKARLISRHKEAQWRRCHLEPATLTEAAGWIDQHRRMWHESFDALAEYLDQTQPTEDNNGAADATHRPSSEQRKRR